MQYPLILCSSFSTVKDKLASLKFLPTAKCKVACITNGADTYRMPGEADPYWITSDLDALTELWYELEDIDLKVVQREDLRKKLIEKDIIFVSGGNCFWLLDLMNKSWFKDMIKEVLAQWKVYIGSSAWSCIMCPDVEYAKFLDDATVTTLTSYEALWFLPVYIAPHFEWEKRSEKQMALVEFVYQKWVYPLITLTNAQAICASLDWNMKFII